MLCFWECNKDDDDDDDDDEENFAFQETVFGDRKLRRNKQRIAWIRSLQSLKQTRVISELTAVFQTAVPSPLILPKDARPLLPLVFFYKEHPRKEQ